MRRVKVVLNYMWVEIPDQRIVATVSLLQRFRDDRHWVWKKSQLPIDATIDRRDSCHQLTAYGARHRSSTFSIFGFPPAFPACHTRSEAHTYRRRVAPGIATVRRDRAWTEMAVQLNGLTSGHIRLPPGGMHMVSPAASVALRNIVRAVFTYLSVHWDGKKCTCLTYIGPQKCKPSMTIWANMCAWVSIYTY